jgi:hypothetical protein
MPAKQGHAKNREIKSSLMFSSDSFVPPSPLYKKKVKD